MRFQIRAKKWIEGFGDEWTPVKFHMQVAPVKKVLASVAKICGSGNRVVFDDDEGSFIENKSTGKRTWLTKRGGVYFYELWVKKADKKKGKPTKTDGDGDVNMDLIIREKVDKLEGMINKLQEGFGRLGGF